MKVLLFGATGMVGQGVLRECLLDPEVESVLSVSRHPSNQSHPKLREILHRDFLDFSPLAADFRGWDACLFCLGVSSAGMDEPSYRRVTFGFTLAAAELIASLNPGLTFIYVSGAGTDGGERGRSMWARVKGATENALFRLPFKAAYAFRPAAIVPMHGIRSRTAIYRFFYALLGPLLPLLRRTFPAWLTSTEELGKAMLKVAKRGWTAPVIEARDIPRI